MTWTESNISIERIDACDDCVLVGIRHSNSGKVLQCYMNGRLQAAQSSPASRWTVELPPLRGNDLVTVIAVDLTDAATNHWSAVHGGGTDTRIRVEVPATIAPHGPADRWRIRLGGANTDQADVVAHEAAIYPGGRRACGWGAAFGDSGLGWDGRDAVGCGQTWGRGELGFDCAMLTWESQPLSPGVYPVEVELIDPACNVSSPTRTLVTIEGRPRPARDLAVQSYDPVTDTLVLTFSASEDM